MSTLTQFFGGSGGGIPATAVPVEALIVGGGGSGGRKRTNQGGSGGGGAGLFVEATNLFLARDITFTVTVGAGGAQYSSGSASSFGELIAIGGGYAGGQPSNGANTKMNAAGGGSGGGAMSYDGDSCNGYSAGGAGVGNFALAAPVNGYFGSATSTLTTISFYGNKGGDAYAGFQATGGGGGGAGGPGGNGAQLRRNLSSNTNWDMYNGHGGDGRVSSITGTATYYAGGGCGGCWGTNFYQGGAGGGGSINANGAANTGGGGGGQDANSATVTTGGSGIVIIAYPNTYPAATVTGSPSTPSRSGYRVYRFTGSGSILIPS